MPPPIVGTTSLRRSSSTNPLIRLDIPGRAGQIAAAPPTQNPSDSESPMLPSRPVHLRRAPSGVPMLTTHPHGGHHPARFDGFPVDLAGHDGFVFGPGQHFDHCYPILDVGRRRGKEDKTERPASHNIEHEDRAMMARFDTQE